MNLKPTKWYYYCEITMRLAKWLKSDCILNHSIKVMRTKDLFKIYEG